jgi:hypothetical protein
VTNAAFFKVFTAAMVGAVVMGAALGWLILLEPEDFRPAMADVCDDAVHTLMTTKDMVELERSKYLIGKLRCRVSPRLEDMP